MRQKLLFTVLLLGMLSLACRSSQMVHLKPFSEDGYYLLSIARNMGRGHGITIDGQTLTNGFQPLYALPTALAYWITADDELAIRLVALLNAVMFGASALLFGWLARRVFRRDDAYWSGALLFLCAAHLFVQYFNGLETGLTILLHLLVARVFCGLDWRRLGHVLGFGALLGLLVLARIDAAIVVALFASNLLLLAWLQRGKGTAPAGERPLLDMVLVTVAALVVSSPWWTFNWFCFGSLLPISGHAQMQAPGDDLGWRIGGVGLSVLQNLVPFLYYRGVSLPVVYLAHGAVVAACLVMVRRAGLHPVRSLFAALQRGDRLAQLGVPFVVSQLVLCVWYVSAFWNVDFYSRYLAPTSILGVLMCQWAGHRLLLVAPRFVLLLQLGLAVISGVTLVSAHTGFLVKGSQWIDDQLGLVEELVPAGVPVAAWQTGTLGYFRAGVINLDGKVNPEALKNAHDMLGYLDRLGVDYLCEWHYYIEQGTDLARFDREWRKLGSRGRYDLWHRERDKR